MMFFLVVLAKFFAIASAALAQLRGNEDGNTKRALEEATQSNTIFFHKAGLDERFVFGKTWAYYRDKDITGDLGGFLAEDFQSHRSGRSGFLYRITADLHAGKTYTLQLGFAELVGRNCAPGMRIMNIFVNDEVFASNLDVFDNAGCQAALVLEKSIEIGSDTSTIEIRFESLANHPMISFIAIKQELSTDFSPSPTMVVTPIPTAAPPTTTTPVPTQIPTSAAPASLAPSTDVPVADSTVTLYSTVAFDNVLDVVGRSWTFNSGTKDIGGESKGLPLDAFGGHRSGPSGFRYVISNPWFVPGKTYVLSLGFAETFTKNCEEGARVMNIYVNDKEFVKELDAFAEAGCTNALVVEKEIVLTETDTFDIRFESLKQHPMVSIISVKEFVPSSTPDCPCWTLQQLARDSLYFDEARTERSPENERNKILISRYPGEDWYTLTETTCGFLDGYGTGYDPVTKFVTPEQRDVCKNQLVAAGKIVLSRIIDDINSRGLSEGCPLWQDTSVLVAPAESTESEDICGASVDHGWSYWGWRRSFEGFRSPLCTISSCSFEEYIACVRDVAEVCTQVLSRYNFQTRTSG